MKTTKETVTINYYGVELTVIGNYTPSESETYENPSFASEFDFNIIEVNGIDIIDLMDEKHFESIANMCIEKIED